MAPTDNSKWAMLRELALARFPKDVKVAEPTRKTEELVGQQPGDAAAFAAATETVVQAEEDRRFVEALQVVNCRPRTIIGSR
jgi:hypothetical protein